MSNTTTIKPTKKHARKIVELLGHGLVSGLGQPEPGKMCVESAVCFALGLPHGDNPKCVGSAVRDFKIMLNDCLWPSEMDRAEGMKRLAVAQLGSDSLDQMKFEKLMYLRWTQRILPFIWRKEAATLTKEKSEAMLGWVAKMEAIETSEEAKQIAKYLYGSASASASASAYAYVRLRLRLRLRLPSRTSEAHSAGWP